jgi:hypothetical protein
MSSTASSEVLKNLQLLFQDGTSGDSTDGELLDRFTCRRDESAFAILVERHGVMVLRVCRAILADEHDAHDAFQATSSASAIGSPSEPGLTPFGGGFVSGGAPR